MPRRINWTAIHKNGNIVLGQYPAIQRGYLIGPPLLPSQTSEKKDEETPLFKIGILTETFGSLFTPLTVGQTHASHGTVNVKLRKTRVSYHSALWVIIAFRGGVPRTMFWMAGVWATDACVNCSYNQIMYNSLAQTSINVHKFCKTNDTYVLFFINKIERKLARG